MSQDVSQAAQVDDPSPLKGVLQRARVVAPGLMLALLVALAATFLFEHHGGSVMLLALLLGMAFHFLSSEKRTAPGIDFASRTVLRIGVGLLGARVTFDQISALGPRTILVVACCVAATIGFGLLVARLAGRHWSFGMLTGGAVAICGASAALAIAAVLPRRHLRDKDILFTVVAVTSLSTLAMVLYPILFARFGFGEREAGLLIGATIHDVAQVVGAGYAVSDEAGDTATIVKLMRVALLPVVVGALWFASRSGEGSGAMSLPFFLVAFCALVVLNSLGLLPQTLASFLSDLSRWLLVTAIAALGMKTALKDMFALGAGHIVVVVSITLFLLALAVGLTW